MAIAFVDAKGGNNGGVGGNYDLTTLTVSGSNTILLAAATANSGVNQTSGITWDPTGAAQALTRIGNEVLAVGRRLSFWYLINPTPGNKILRYLQTGGDYLLVSASVYSGAKQTGQPDSHADSNGGASPQTGTTTVVASGCWLVMAASGESGSTGAGTGATLRAGDGFGGNINAIMDSNGTVGTGSQSLQATSAGNIAWNIISIAPAAGASTFAPPPFSGQYSPRFYSRRRTA